MLIEFLWRIVIASVFLYAGYMSWWRRQTDRPALQPPRTNLAIWLTLQGVWYAALAVAAPYGAELEPWWTGSSRVINTGLAVAIMVVVKTRTFHHGI